MVQNTQVRPLDSPQTQPPPRPGGGPRSPEVGARRPAASGALTGVLWVALAGLCVLWAFSQVR